MLIGQLAMPVYAEEKDSALEKTYEDELSSAIISGSGTEDDPYICDFDKAPFFKNYLKENWDRKNTLDYQVTAGVGFTGNCLTVYKGIYNNGGVWLYSSGGMSADNDGNIRIKKVTYNTVEQVHIMYALNPTSTTWNALKALFKDAASMYLPGVESLVVSYFDEKGITNVGGFSISKIAKTYGTILGAAKTIKSTYRLLNSIAFAGVRNAHQANKTLVNIDYITAYHGSWYTYDVSETGWSGNVIYLPVSVYGNGSFRAY